MRRTYSTVNSGISVLSVAVFILIILTSEPCFSECDFEWKPGKNRPIHLNDDVYALTMWDPDANGPQQELLIVGGIFDSPLPLGGEEADYILTWDGNSCQPLGNGIIGCVRALTVYDGQLIAGGDFTIAGGVDANFVDVNFVAAWDGNGWHSLGGGMSGYLEEVPKVYALTVYNGELIAGGRFATAGGVDANCIARWDGSTWQPLGTGMNYTVVDLTVYNGKLIAGGLFTTAGGVSANRIAAWDGNSWQPFGSGVSSYVHALTVYNGELVAGGLFTTAGGIDANGIAAWDGNSWHALGSGMSGGSYPTIPVRRLAVYKGDLIAGGDFTTAGDVDANYIAAWDGNSWQPLDNGMSGGSLPTVRALAVYKEDLIAGGGFTTAGDVAAGHIARWDDSIWQTLGTGRYEWFYGSSYGL